MCKVHEARAELAPQRGSRRRHAYHRILENGPRDLPQNVRYVGNRIIKNLSLEALTKGVILSGDSSPPGPQLAITRRVLVCMGTVLQAR